MSKIDKSTANGTEFREDGSKVATEDNPSGETETEHTQREESKLPHGGQAPEYRDAERESGVAHSRDSDAALKDVSPDELFDDGSGNIRDESSEER